MEEYEDLDAYNGDTEHDMCVDFDYNENTGELSSGFPLQGLHSGQRLCAVQ